MIPRDRAFRRWRRVFAGFAGLSLASAAFGKGSGSRQECGNLVNCKYFGCYPKGTKCPADCDEYLTPEACHAVKTSSGRNACLFNPQYSGGKGLCQKDVVCFNLGSGKCSDNCFHCAKFGCLPDDTDCPAPCSAFNSQSSCETLGGVAGGMACQWNRTNDFCAFVPLSQLTRTLSPSPVRPYPAFKIRDGVTITPSAFPGPPATSTTQPAVGSLAPIGSSSGPKSALDWTSVEGHPGRLALFIGGAVALLGLVCVVALLFYRRAKKSRMNEVLARGYSENSSAGVGGNNSVDVGVRDGVRRRSTLPSPPPPSTSLPISPKTQFHRESLLVHVRKAVGLLYDQPSEPPSVSLPRNADGRREVGGSFLAPPSAALPWKPSDRAAAIDVAAESPLSTVVHTNGANVSSCGSDGSSAILTHPFRS